MNKHASQDAGIRRAVGKVQAFVRIRDTEISYTRCGSGAPVVVCSADKALRDLLSAELARKFSVISPELRVHCDDAPGTLRLSEFIDGLGLQRPHLVATDPYGPAALDFALRDADRIDRLAIVWCEFREVKSDEIRGALEDRLCGAGHPLLLLRLATQRLRTTASARAALATVIRFLSAESDSSTAP